MSEDIKDIKKGLGIDEYLELIKKDKILSCAYVSLGQYIYMLEKNLEDEILNKEIAQGHKKEIQDIELRERKQNIKYKEVLDKIKEKLNNRIIKESYYDTGNDLVPDDDLKGDLLELLEEVE